MCKLGAFLYAIPEWALPTITFLIVRHFMPPEIRTCHFALRTRTPLLLPAALAFVSSGFVLVRVSSSMKLTRSRGRNNVDDSRADMEVLRITVVS